MRTWLSGALIGAFALVMALRFAVEQGYAQCRAEQKIADDAAFAELIERLDNAGIDASDPAAVDAILRGIVDGANSD